MLQSGVKKKKRERKEKQNVPRGGVRKKNRLEPDWQYVRDFCSATR